MKKIFAYVGSGAGERSHTYKYIESILSAVKSKMGENVEYEMYTPKNTEIAGCKSCNQCFDTGACVIDDIQPLKEKMLEADFIILGSPVFLHNISSDMMRLLERIAYWSKTMELAGKFGMAVSTNSGNGHNIIIDYLEKSMTQLGIYIVAKDNVALHVPAEFFNEKLMKEKADHFSNLIIARFENPEIAASSSADMMNRLFDAKKRAALSCEILDLYIYRRWRDSGMFEYKSYYEYFASKVRTAK